MNIQIGITEPNRQAVANELAKILADETVLYFKTKNAHWNIEGDDFYDKHKFFEGQFGQLDIIIDSVAERIRTLGHYVSGSLSGFLELTHLSEDDLINTESNTFMADLLSDHESIVVFLRENIHRFGGEFRDFGTSDFITGIMEEHEKMAWFLRSHLNTPKKHVS